MTARYPDYDVLDKWESVSFDTKTRAVLRRRLHNVPERQFFTQDEWDLMEAVCARMSPTPERGPRVPITPWIDAKLMEGDTEGFRFESMPPEHDAWRMGLKALAEESVALYARPFAELDPDSQEAVLKRVQKGEVDAKRWAGLDPKMFFTNLLLREVAGIYYAHPQAWSEMGFGGPASPRGYVRMGLNEQDPWEAKEAAPAAKTRRVIGRRDVK